MLKGNHQPYLRVHCIVAIISFHRDKLSILKTELISERCLATKFSYFSIATKCKVRKNSSRSKVSKIFVQECCHLLSLLLLLLPRILSKD